MNKVHTINFHFLSEPQDVNFGGKVHGGTVMKWIDQTAYTCACNWAGSYCVTVYVGGIRFYKPINIGDQVKVEAKVIYTGNTSIHIAVDVHSKKITSQHFDKKTHCVIVFVAVDSEGLPTKVEKWIPRNESDQRFEDYAKRLKNLRSNIEKEMIEFL